VPRAAADENDSAVKNPKTPKPQNPRPYTLDPKPQNPKPYTLDPKP